MGWGGWGWVGVGTGEASWWTGSFAHLASALATAMFVVTGLVAPSVHELSALFDKYDNSGTELVLV